MGGHIEVLHELVEQAGVSEGNEGCHAAFCTTRLLPCDSFALKKDCK
jgi:hypothetical protein